MGWIEAIVIVGLVASATVVIGVEYKQYCYCGTNEEFVHNMTFCTDDCTLTFHYYPFCPHMTINSCICKEGYFRHPWSHECIPKADCPPSESPIYENDPIFGWCPGINEVYVMGNACREACDPEGMQCSQEDTLDCFCRPGFKRHKYTRKCIPEACCQTAYYYDFYYRKQL